MFKKLKLQFGKLSVILLAVIAFLIFADLITKYLEEQFVWNAVIIPDFVVIKSGVHNPGCAFSFLDEHPEVGQPILITLTFILLAVMIFAFLFLPNRFVVTKIAISLIIAGAIGNLVDRIVFRYVRDWFGLNMFGRIAYCNFADFWIVIGAALAVIDMLFLNEWAVFPLTKHAKEVQRAKKEEEERKNSDSTLGVGASENETHDKSVDTPESVSEAFEESDKDNGN